MKRMVVCMFLAAVLGCGSAIDTSHLPNDVLHLEAKIPLPGVTGRIDHLAYDSAGRRLFLAALGNNTVEVIDLATHSRVHTITGLREPQGVQYIPSLDRIIVANGSNGSVVFYDGHSFAELGHIELGDDADNVRYDGKELYIGYGSGGIAVIDPASMKQVGDLQLKGHPESFQLGDSDHIYINVPDNGEIVTGDLKTLKLSNHWKNSGASANFPMALARSTPTPPALAPRLTTAPALAPHPPAAPALAPRPPAAPPLAPNSPTATPPAPRPTTAPPPAARPPAAPALATRPPAAPALAPRPPTATPPARDSLTASAREDHRLFVAYRHPAVLRTLDDRTGSVLASVPCVGDADDLFYDAASGLVFVSGGGGYLDVFQNGVLVNHLPTRRGARTGLWLPKEKKFIVAVPARSGEDAALWIYRL